MMISSKLLRVIFPSILFLVCAPEILAQRDDFFDGDDSGWERYDPFVEAGVGAQVTFDASTGAYRIASPASPSPAQLGPARAAAFRSDVYTDFCVAVDVPAYDLSLGQAFGILARVQPGYGLGSVNGYAMTFHPFDNDIQITRVDNEQPVELSPYVFLSGPSPSGVLRFVFIGIGDLLIGRVYDASNPLVPLAETSIRDTSHSMGICGLLIFDNTRSTGAADATFDNYVATDCSPPVTEVRFEGGDELTISWRIPFDWYDIKQSLDLDSWGDVPAGGGLVYYQDGVFYFDTLVPGSSPTRCFRLHRHPLPDLPAPG